MRVIQVIPRIFDNSSGTSHSIPGLSAALQEAGAEVDLYTLEPRPQMAGFEGIYTFPCWPGRIFHRLGLSTQMKHSLRSVAPKTDIIHTNSLWMMPNIYPAKAIKGTRCRLVISPRGTLSQWALANSSRRKKFVSWLGQNNALRKAHCLHATSEGELSDIRRLGFDNPVALIPNGISCPEICSTQRKIKSPATPRTLLFLSRIHPTKGVDLLLHTWRHLESDFPLWRLLIAGPIEHSYGHEIKALAKQLGVERVEFIGEVGGQRKKQVFLDSDLFVLPTHSENFGIAIGEALAHGIPAIVTRGAPWQGLTQHRCGWWIEHSSDVLTSTLRRAMSEPSESLFRMGERGAEWVKSDFSWLGIGARMLQTYQWICGKLEKPEWVEVK